MKSIIINLGKNFEIIQNKGRQHVELYGAPQMLTWETSKYISKQIYFPIGSKNDTTLELSKKNQMLIIHDQGIKIFFAINSQGRLEQM